MQPPDSFLTGPHLQQHTGMQARSTTMIECPKAMVGRVIGKNGETIKALQTYTRSLIQVNQMKDPCSITITGALLSMNLALSMVSDIVKGSFKGFALLRQLAGPAGGTQQRQPRPAQLQQQQLPSAARRVYAPGYGRLPTSQIFGNEEEWMMPADMGMSGSAATHGLVHSGNPSLPGHMEGLQHMGQQPLLYGLTGAAVMNQQMPHLQQGNGAMPRGMPFGGMPYYQPLEVPGMNAQTLDALVYQGPSKTMYGADDSAAGGANSQQHQWAYMPGLTSDNGSSQQQLGALFLSQLPLDNRMPQRHSGVAHPAGRQDRQGAGAQQHFLPGGEGSDMAVSGAGSNTTKVMQAASGGTSVASGISWLSDNERYGFSNVVSELVHPGSSGKLSPVMSGGGGRRSPLVIMGQDGKLYYINHE